MRNGNPSDKNNRDKNPRRRQDDSGRSEYVRSFKVNIDNESDDGYASDKPSGRGAVYFSNPPKYNSSAPHPEAKKKADISNPNLSPEIRRAMKNLESGVKPSGTPRKAPSQPARRPEGKAAPLSGKTSAKMKKLVRRKGAGVSPAIVMVLVVFICSMVLSLVAISCMNDVLAINRSDEPVEVSIPDNAKTDDIVDILSDSGLIHQPAFCKLFIKLKAKLMDIDLGKEEYLSGMYYLKANMGIESMLAKFKQQQSATTVSLYFPEGWTVEQIFKKLEKYDVCPYDYLMSALKKVKFGVDFADEIYSDERAYLNLEGFLFPDTYEFFENENANSVIRRFLANFDSKWTPEYAERAEELGLTMKQVIIIASIIEREAANSDQMPIISSVLHNRLDAAASYPFLECDSTADYVTNYIKPNVPDVQIRSYNEIYNTYLCQSLPAGPICNPGADAIQAALYPDDTDYYYFQHDDKGKIYLASTKAEHDRNKLEVVEANNG